MLNGAQCLQWIQRNTKTKADVARLLAQSGCLNAPQATKATLIDTLKDALCSKYNSHRIPKNLVALDMGLSNMGLARFSCTPKSVTLDQSVKLDLTPSDTAYDPGLWAKLADGLIFGKILNQYAEGEEVTLVVERQRFRTNGSFNVLQTTLDVNIMEAMIFMTVHMNNKNPSARNRIQLLSVSPATMVSYWNGKLLDPAQASDSASVKLLRLKIAEQLINDSMQGDYKADHSERVVEPRPYFSLNKAMSRSLPLDVWKKATGYRSHSRRFFQMMQAVNEYGDEKYRVDNWGTKKGDDLCDAILHGLMHWEISRFREDLIERVQKDIRNDKSCIEKLN